jgi:hypothetical protein
MFCQDTKNYMEECNHEKMRMYVCVGAWFLIAILVIQGCSMLEPPDRQGLETVDGEAVLTYYSKDVGEAFAKFLQDPVAAAPSRSVLAAGESAEISDEELFASLWVGLTEEERAKVLENADTVEVESGLGSAYVFGTYNHAGIFSKERYKDGGSTDYAHSVYTAQPKFTSNYDSDIRPDRSNKACLDTLRLYTRQKKLAVIEPRNYTQNSAAAAVNYAKTIFYDANADYDLPYWEALGIGNSSHNLTKENTYCSKVAYVAWKKAGIDLDGKRWSIPRSLLRKFATPGNVVGRFSDRGMAHRQYNKFPIQRRTQELAPGFFIPIICLVIW